MANNKSEGFRFDSSVFSIVSLNNEDIEDKAY